MISVKSYSYSKLVLAYGSNQGATVTIQWSTNDKAFKLVFGRSKFSNFNIYLFDQWSNITRKILFITYLYYRSCKYNKQCTFYNEGTIRSSFK